MPFEIVEHLSKRRSFPCNYISDQTWSQEHRHERKCLKVGDVAGDVEPLRKRTSCR